MSDRHVLISVLFFQEPEEPGLWIAQALEYDIAAYGRDVPAATHAFARTLEGHLLLATRQQRPPFANLQPAPDMFWTIWQRLIAAEPTPVGAQRLIQLPAYMIPAVSHEPLSPAH